MPEPTENPAPTEQAQREARLGRAFCRALDEALETGRLGRADRLARSAGRLADRDPRVALRLARMALSAGDPEAALQTIERCRGTSTAMRLLRAVLLLDCGRRAEAHLDLAAWAHRPTAPMAARALLAWLELQRGDEEAASVVLRQNLRHLRDPRTVALLCALCARRRRSTPQRYWGERLRDLLDDHPDELMGPTLLRSLGLPSQTHETANDPRRVQALALELCAEEACLPALVEARRRQPDSARLQLLRRALAIAAPDLEDQSAAAAAMAALESMADTSQPPTWRRAA